MQHWNSGKTGSYECTNTLRVPSQVSLELECGDIVLFSRPCEQMDLFSSLICFGAKLLGYTEWDHLGLIIENPDTNELFLLEANRGGITILPLLQRLTKSRSTKLAVRKLTILHPNNTVLDAQNSQRQEFIDKLWDLSNEYINKKASIIFFIFIIFSVCLSKIIDTGYGLIFSFMERLSLRHANKKRFIYYL